MECVLEINTKIVMASSGLTQESQVQAATVYEGIDSSVTNL